MLTAGGSLVKPQAQWGGLFERTGAQPGAGFPADTKADFDVPFERPVGVVREAAGDYRLTVEGTWQITASLILTGTGVLTARPRVSVFDVTSGAFLAYQEQSAALLGVGTGGFTLTAQRRLNGRALVQVFWNADVAAADLTPIGGLGCSLAFRWMGP